MTPSSQGLEPATFPERFSAPRLEAIVRDGQFEFTDMVSGSHAIVSIRVINEAVLLTVVRDIEKTGNPTDIVSVVLPPDVAADVGRYLVAQPEPDDSLSDVIAAGFAMAQRGPDEVIDLEERGELDDTGLDEGLWFALLGLGVSCERLASFPPAVRMFFSTRLVEWEVGNGGFAQALQNAGSCFEEATAGYELIGDDASAALLLRAAESRHDDEQLEALDAQLDGPPWNGVPWGDARRLAYVRAHRDEFRL